MLLRTLLRNGPNRDHMVHLRALRHQLGGIPIVLRRHEDGRERVRFDPVLIMKSAGEESRAKALDAGANDYLTVC